ncbi:MULTISPECIES: hypothetical protein [Streptomyces]|uniref:Uncharacterized protein n=1 Tax=Streptomyces venezuelae TaxID=54571 RepID=A0A5P2B8M3_STRVZ|nr:MULTISPECIES: hypothetical protein [Streptomyces]NEA03788.1 hypothetical protein [Streptomyces sp. SID10116]MYY87226.1 hypothetical protein [Streptomyces sp. SID335]MYZ17699.1 hypothetical protein [Streptomyces sp. SID337]NEB44837.1 hypothetical protein [Streptomyces sp. SID339]QES26250.1 hypothetical protein DEJ47_07015 [Streptomyces venezuelae]
MSVRIEVRGPAGSDAALVRDLHAWLQREDDLRGRVGLAGAAPEPGQMGAVSELVLTAVSSGTVAALVASAQLWIKQRRANLSIVVRHPDGKEVEIDAEQISGAEEFIRTVLRDADPAP